MIVVLAGCVLPPIQVADLSYRNQSQTTFEPRACQKLRIKNTLEKLSRQIPCVYPDLSLLLTKHWLLINVRLSSLQGIAQQASTTRSLGKSALLVGEFLQTGPVSYSSWAFILWSSAYLAVILRCCYLVMIWISIFSSQFGRFGRVCLRAILVLCCGQGISFEVRDLFSLWLLDIYWSRW